MSCVEIFSVHVLWLIAQIKILSVHSPKKSNIYSSPPCGLFCIWRLHITSIVFYKAK
ncbi:unnamed protein product [Brassica rapa subsp. trilocularis]